MVSAAGADYTYNVQGLRTSKTVGNKTTNFTVVNGKIFSDGTRNYVWGLELITNGSIYYLYNAHGDVIQLVNTNGTVTMAYDYDAYGNELIRGYGDTNPFRYCGEYYDTETGFIYLRARYYDPSTGRFISQDTHWNVKNMIYGDTPVEVQGVLMPDQLAIKQSGNLYLYCSNDPVNYSDKTGEIGTPIQWVLSIVFGIAGWGFGDYVAKELGLSGWQYWAVRSAVAVGGAAIGWFTGTAITNVVSKYIIANPSVVFKIANSIGAGATVSIMRFLGVDPFKTINDSSKFFATIRCIFNTPDIKIGFEWAKSLIMKAAELGHNIRLDAGHDATRWQDVWHINIGKLHVAIEPDIVEKVKEFIEELGL